MKINSVLDISIWTLLRLHTELEEIADKLDQIAFEFDLGNLDFDDLETTKTKVEQCRKRLERAFTKSEANNGQ